MTEKIKIILIKRGMMIKDLCEALKTTNQNMNGKFKRDNFSEKELREIAEALGCRLEIRFIDKETGEEM